MTIQYWRIRLLRASVADQQAKHTNGTFEATEDQGRAVRFANTFTIDPAVLDDVAQHRTDQIISYQIR